MQLIYYAHSYRPEDDRINEFFQELMLDEQVVPSLDPKSNRLNAAKPERHLRSTDALVAVVTRRDPEPSPYIRWEISRALRARRPQLVFVEDMLADCLVPPGVLQRRFSRRRLLRETRDHRHAIQLLKSYIGTDPPPNFQPPTTRRRCVLIGGSRFGRESLAALVGLLESLHYFPCPTADCSEIPAAVDIEQALQGAALCIALVEGLAPTDYYLLGMAQSALTPTILLTQNKAFQFAPHIPEAYQPRYVPLGDAGKLVDTIRTEIEIFEEDYLELVEEKQVRRYHEFQTRLLATRSESPSRFVRQQVFNFMANAEVDMSTDKIHVSGVVGPVNIKSRLDHVQQIVQQGQRWSSEEREQLAALVAELKAGLLPVAEQRPEDAERVEKTTELVVAEATKAKPDKGFLSLSVEGLKHAAQSVADIAPVVISVARKIADFLVDPKG